MRTLIQDLHFIFRTFAKRPGLTLLAVLTLALGIGGTTFAFDLLNLVVWRWPSVPEPERVARVYTASHLEDRNLYGSTSYPDFERYRDACKSFTGLSVEVSDRIVLNFGDSFETLNSWAVSGNYFEMLRVPAATGRVLSPEDDVVGRPPVLVLSYALWQRSFGGDPAILGQMVRLNDHPFLVVGVAAADFTGTAAGDRPALWFPVTQVRHVFDPSVQWLEKRDFAWLVMIGRLEDGVTREAAKAELDIYAAELNREHPLPDFNRRMTVTPATLMEARSKGELLPTVRLILAAVGFLLALACANVANLLLARSATRSREMGVRIALGASGGRLVRLMLTESLSLAALGALGGLLVAFWTRRFLEVYLAHFVVDLGFDFRVLGLTLVVTALSGLVLGLVPAWNAARLDVTAAVKDTIGGDGRSHLALGELLVVMQMAICVVLLAGAGLMAQSLWNFQRADLGFGAEHAVIADIALVSQRFDSPEKGQVFYRRLSEDLEALPEIRAVGFAFEIPPAINRISSISFYPSGAPHDVRTTGMNFVNSAYFDILDIPLVQGRLFSGHEKPTDPGVVVVNEELAEWVWPGEDPIGRRIYVPRFLPIEAGPEFEVIGVVRNSVQTQMRRPSEPIVYFAQTQRYRPFTKMVIEATNDRGAAIRRVREKLRRLGTDIMEPQVLTMEDHRWSALREERFQTQSLLILSGVGLLLAVVGIFGVMSYNVSRRVREIGVRMALGARRIDTLLWIVRRGMTPAALGVVVGLMGSVWTARLLEGLVYGVSPRDPLTLALTSVVLLLAALLAVFLPARRASRVDPLAALRYE